MINGISISISISVDGGRSYSASGPSLNNIRSESNINLIAENGIEIISQ